MNWNHWIRQTHRWLSIGFVLTVIANFVQIGMNDGQQVAPNWITYSPLVPLFFLSISGLYMFFLPYVARRRRGGEAAA